MTRKRKKPTTATRYEVGYGKPPRHTQFKPGKSGNPRGRPRGSKNFATPLDQELSSKVTVNEGGKRRTLAKRSVIVKRLVNKAAEGDDRAINTILKQQAGLEKKEGGALNPNNRHTLDPGDDAILANFEKSILEKAKKPRSSKAPGPATKKETDDD